MKKIFLTYCITFCSFYAFCQTVNRDFVDGKIWFKLKDLSDPPAANLHQENFNLEYLSFLLPLKEKFHLQQLSKPFASIKKTSPLQHTYLLTFSNKEKVEELIKQLQENEMVEYAEKVPISKTTLTPNDPTLSLQWHLAKIKATGAWNYFSTGSNIVIAIVDNAIDRTHSDLSPNLWVNPGEIAGNGIDDEGNGHIDDINGWDVSNNDNDPNPPNNNYDHGTHVAGIASAATNNATGVASIGFSCKLMCVKSAANDSLITDGYGGIIYAADNGANVINCSWGGQGFSNTEKNAVDYAKAQGCIVVAAAGNDNTNSLFYPAAFTGVISVAATNNDDTKASFSNYGSWVTISAPGNNIRSTVVGNSYGTKSGTSMASPLVAGLVGLMLSLNPQMTYSQVLGCLGGSATNIDALNPSYGGKLGAGRIDAEAAMQCVNTLLPVKLIYFHGRPITEGNLLNWAVSSEIKVSQYVVERSSNGRDFSMIGKVNAGSNGTSSTYNYIDSRPQSLINYYRLKMVDLDGKFAYSLIISVKGGIQENALQLFPNPLKAGTAEAHLLLAGVERGMITIKITNPWGQLMLVKKVSGAEGFYQSNLPVSFLSSGVYIITCFNEKNVKVGNGKLVITK